jgi:1-acyl-sn-glycerol-3-phosphate acyltransferase
VSLRPARGRPLLRVVLAANVCFARVYHRLEVRSPCRLPRRGPAILVCNHTSGLDPALIQSACPRLIVWMMAREYYDLPALRRFFELLDVIPVERGTRDTAATRQALRTLSQGRVLGVFPEGRIENSKELLPFQTGVAMMALKTSVPVFPAYLDGSQRRQEMLQAYLRRQDASIEFGPQIDLRAFASPRADVEPATNAIRQAVNLLRPTSA